MTSCDSDMTSSAGHVIGLLFLITTVQAAALQTVRQVSITAEASDDVTITWLPAEPPPNGTVTYELSCYQRHDPKTIRYSKTSETSLKLDYPLDTPVDYVAQVRVIDQHGEMSSWTRPTIFRIFESKVPPAPQKIVVDRSLPHTLSISWQSPDFPVSGYRLYYTDAGNDMDDVDEVISNDTTDGYQVKEIPHQVNEYHLPGVEEHSTYIVRLQARNVAGEYGPLSEAVPALSDVIGGNDTLRINDVTWQVGSTWVDMHWERPKPTIKYFVITYHGIKRYKAFNNNTETDIESARSIRISGQDGNYTLTELKSYMLYTICIQALWKGKKGPAAEFDVKTDVGPPPIEGMPIVLQPKEDNSRVLIVSMPKVSDRNGPVIFCDLIVVQSVFYDLLTPDQIQYDPTDENNPIVRVPMEYYFIADKPYVTARFLKVPQKFELGNWEFINKYLNKGLKFDNHYRLTFRAYTDKHRRTRRHVHTSTVYSPRFEIHEDHSRPHGSSNDLAGTQLVLFVIADVMLFCLLSALGKLCHAHLADFCEKRSERRRSRMEENGKRMRGFAKSVSLEMT